MGVYVNEGISEKFVTLGAKKYAQVKDGELKVTVAGVNKFRKGNNPSGAEELGDIEKFKDGFIWSKAGGTRAIYNDNDTDIDLQIDGHNLHISSNVAIVPTTYKLSTSIDIEDILKRISNSSLEWLRKIILIWKDTMDRVKKSKLYQPSGYPDIEYLLSKGLPFMWLIGGRGIGKTYTILETIVLNRHTKFILLRRKASEVKKLSTEAFNVFKN